ncbi:MAG TPA: MerR family transcriptional regulator [Acidimicrobiales bacterium]|nr:MerR family transcriptional regulator [Acidimicrobiales bacterium]
MAALVGGFSLRIGDVAARTGVSVPALRAWENRYGLLTPHRTPGGHRLYSEDDVDRVRRVQLLVAHGWTVAAAAREARRRALSDSGDKARPAVRADGDSAARQLLGDLLDGVRRFDVDAMQRAIGSVFEFEDVAGAIEHVLVPALREVGRWWRDEPGAVANEHAFSHILRGRLSSVLRTFRSNRRPLCVALAPEGELHDIGLLMASLLVAQDGWSVTFLGADTPVAAVEAALRRLTPGAVLVAAYRRGPAQRFLAGAQDLAARVVLGGPGFRPADVAGRPSWAYAAGIGEVVGVLAPR